MRIAMFSQIESEGSTRSSRVQSRPSRCAPPWTAVLVERPGIEGRHARSVRSSGLPQLPHSYLRRSTAASSAAIAKPMEISPATLPDLTLPYFWPFAPTMCTPHPPACSDFIFHLHPKEPRLHSGHASTSLRIIACPRHRYPPLQSVVRPRSLHPRPPNAPAVRESHSGRWIPRSSAVYRVTSVAITHDSNGGLRRVHAEPGAGRACRHDRVPCCLHRRRLSAPRFAHRHCQKGIT